MASARYSALYSLRHGQKLCTTTPRIIAVRYLVPPWRPPPKRQELNGGGVCQDRWSQGPRPCKCAATSPLETRSAAIPSDPHHRPARPWASRAENQGAFGDRPRKMLSIRRGHIILPVLSLLQRLFVVGRARKSRGSDGREGGGPAAAIEAPCKSPSLSFSASVARSPAFFFLLFSGGVRSVLQCMYSKLLH